MSGDVLGLRQTQHLFWNLITAPEGVQSGAEDLAACGEIASADLSSFIEPSKTLSPVQRLDIYANMYFYRLRDILADDFTKVAAVTGGARFHNLITDFLLVHPPSRPSLRWLGEPLSAFIASHEISEEHPYLADLARLEWARHDVFDEADAAPLTRESLTALPAGQAESSRMGLVHAVRVLELDWSVAPLWRRIDDEVGATEAGGSHSASIETCDGFAEPFAVESAPERRTAFIRAWRQDMNVYHRSMRPDEAACVQLLARGASLQELAEHLMQRVAEGGDSEHAGAGLTEAQATEVMTRLAALVDLWLNDGVIRMPDDEASPA